MIGTGGVRHASACAALIGILVTAACTPSTPPAPAAKAPAPAAQPAAATTQPPRPTVERLMRLKIAADMGTSLLSQLVSAAVLPRLDEAVEERRAGLAAGHAALAGALARHVPDWTWDTPPGGCVLWVRLPAGDAREFAQ